MHWKRLRSGMFARRRKLEQSSLGASNNFLAMLRIAFQYCGAALKNMHALTSSIVLGLIRTLQVDL